MDSDGDVSGDLFSSTGTLNLFQALVEARERELASLLKPRDLSLQCYRILDALQRRGPCSMQELAASTSMDRTTLTRVVDRLAAAGHVRRSTGSQDRRRVMVELAELGREKIESVQAIVEEFDRRMLRTLSRDEQKRLAHTLNNLLIGCLP